MKDVCILLDVWMILEWATSGLIEFDQYNTVKMIVG